METRGRKKKKDMEMRSPFSELSDDLLVEIISRVPYKSTRCCKCVCTRWRDVVSHPDHRMKLPRSTLAGFFYKTGDLCCQSVNRHYESLTGNWCPGIDPSLSFLPKYKHGEIHIDMLDCCNGLLLCRRQRADYYRTTDYVVFNPATTRWVAVPGTDWSNNVCVARLGFDPVVSSHFHVLEFAPARVTHIRPLGVYSSKAGIWMHRSDWDCPIDIHKFSKSTFLRGMLYFLSSNGDKVIAVDMEGNCRAICIHTSHGYRVARGVYVSQGQLYVAISSASELSIWTLLEDSSSENWTVMHNVSHLRLFGAKDSYVWSYCVIIHPEYKLIFIVYKRFISTTISVTKLMSYDMDSRKLHSMGDLGYDCEGPYLSYVPLFSHSLANGH